MSLIRNQVVSWRIAAAVAIFLVGVSWALSVILQGSPQSLFSTPSSTDARQGRAAIVASAPAPSERQLDDNQIAAFISQTSEQISSALARIPVSAPAALDASRIAAEASESISIFIHPTAERTGSYLIARGDKDDPFVAMKPDERDEFLRTTALCFAGQQPDLSRIEVRWRFIDGREVESAKERGGSSTPRRSFDAVMNPEKHGLTAMEVIVPLPAKTLMMGTKPCRLGFLIGKTRTNPNWTTLQTRSYGIPGNAGLLFPPH